MTGLTGTIEISIKREVILSNATKLDKVASCVSQKKITGRISHSKGKTATSVNNLIQELNNMGTELGRLMNENAKNVRQIAEQFSAKDADLASKFNG